MAEHCTASEAQEAACCEILALVTSVWLDLLRAKLAESSFEPATKSLQKFYLALSKLVQYVSAGVAGAFPALGPTRLAWQHLLLFAKRAAVGVECVPALARLVKRVVGSANPAVYRFLAYVQVPPRA